MIAMMAATSIQYVYDHHHREIRYVDYQRHCGDHQLYHHCHLSKYHHVHLRHQDNSYNSGGSADYPTDSGVQGDVYATQVSFSLEQ